MTTFEHVESFGTGRDDDLRARSFRGGKHLALRELVGIVIRIAGVVLLTRLIGPEDFGVYAGAVAIVMFATMIAQLGTEAYLVRLPEPVARSHFDQAFTAVLIASLTVMAITMAVAPALAVVDSRFVVVTQVLALSIPLNALWAPAQARIEREFRYREMAAIELVGDAVLYGVAVPLALVSPTAWSAVAGFVAWQAWLLCSSYRVAHYRPRWNFSWSATRELARYGTGYSFASWTLTRSAELLNPLVVGPTAGASGVGQVALALRIVESLSFVARAARRLSLVAFARVQHQADRFARAIDEAATLQALAIGLPFAAFALVAQPAVRAVFGPEWDGVVDVYAGVAAALLAASPLMIVAYALHALDRNRGVVLAAAASTLILAGSAIVLVSRYGTAGFGYARVASVAGLLLVIPALRRCRSFSLTRSTVWLVALLPAVAAAGASPAIRVIACIPLIAAMAHHTLRRQLGDYVHAIASHRGVA